MLKSLGIDQLSLKDRLASMDPEQVQHYESMYHRHLNAVVKRGDEAQACEPYLIGQNFSQVIEDELTGKLPFNEADFNIFDGGPQGPFYAEPGCLEDIAQNSPLHKNQILALVALIRCGKAGATIQDWGKALGRLQEEYALDQAVSWESALIYGHWRLLLGPVGDKIQVPQRAIDISRAVLQDNSAIIYKPWAALTLLSSRTGLSESEKDQVKSLAEKAALSTDDELAFSAAISIGQPGPLLKAIEDKEEWRQLVAALALAQLHSSDLLPHLENFSDQNLQTILAKCPSPAPANWHGTLMKLVKTRPNPVDILRLERITLSENNILELSSLAIAKNDKELMAYLIESGCDDSRLIQNGISLIFEPDFNNAWNRLSSKVPLKTMDFAGVTNNDPDQQSVLAQLSRIQVQEHLSEEFYRLSIQRLLSAPFNDVLDNWAYILLLAARLDSDRFNFLPQTICDHYDNPDQFTHLLSDFIRRRLIHEERFSSCDDWLQGFLGAYTEVQFLDLSPDTQIQFSESMLNLVETESLSTYLRASAASCLYPNLLPSEFQPRVINEIHRIIDSKLDYDIQYHLDKAIENS
jgi:hypothetical protein